MFEKLKRQKKRLYLLETSSRTQFKLNRIQKKVFYIKQRNKKKNWRIILHIGKQYWRKCNVTFYVIQKWIPFLLNLFMCFLTSVCLCGNAICFSSCFLYHSANLWHNILFFSADASRITSCTEGSVWHRNIELGGFYFIPNMSLCNTYIFFLIEGFVTLCNLPTVKGSPGSSWDLRLIIMSAVLICST